MPRAGRKKRRAASEQEHAHLEVFLDRWCATCGKAAVRAEHGNTRCPAGCGQNTESHGRWGHAEFTRDAGQARSLRGEGSHPLALMTKKQIEVSRKLVFKRGFFDELFEELEAAPSSEP